MLRRQGSSSWLGRRAGVVALALVSAAGSGCSSSPAVPETEERRLERELRGLSDEIARLIHAEGCAALGQCRSAAMGFKACGGPESYVVYCSSSTDEVRLLATLELHRQKREALARLRGEGSDCRFVSPPSLVFDGAGSCAAATFR